MKLSLAWLREFVPADLGSTALAQALTRAGLAVESIAGEGAAATLEVDPTSNRPDWLSHYGVAREIAAITGAALAPLDHSLPATLKEPDLQVRIEAGAACPRYCALVLEDVRVEASPAAIAARLNLLGHRAINNLADLTNYVLWEMGHPTHAFDADLLRGGEIRVRFARAGERLVTLDEVDRQLDPADLVIADAERPIALAGVMGGLETAISEKTVRVALEGAWFDPITVRRAARRHGLHTDASHRFERGADPQAAPVALARIARRAAGCGARLAGGMIDVGGAPPAPPPIPLRAARLERVLGSPVPDQEVHRILTRLGFQAEAVGWRPPSWRPDVAREIDLVEEVARIHGLDQFPSRLPPFADIARPLPNAAARDAARQQLRGRGYAEAITLSFASPEECLPFAPKDCPVIIVNPLSGEAAAMCTSRLPAMLKLLRHNLHRGVPAPRLFEIGRVYRLENGQPEERLTLTLGASGNPAPFWTGSASAMDFFALKADVEAVVAGFAIENCAVRPADAVYLHPGRLAGIGDGHHGGFLATFGQLHPALAEEWKLPAETYLAEIDLDALHKAWRQPIQYRPPSRFPDSHRDFSFLFADATTWQQVESAVRTPENPDLAELTPIEVFRGPQLPAGHYSLLLRARWQRGDRTLREQEVQEGADLLIAALIRLGGQQR